MLPPDLDNITAGALRSDERLSELYLEAVRRKFLTNSPSTVLEFWCFAEKALHDDKLGTSSKLFYSLVKAKDSKYISDSMEQLALRHLTRVDRQVLVDKADDPTSIVSTAIEDEQYVLFGGEINICYHRVVMMQCFLPSQRLPIEQSLWQINHGWASLALQPGVLVNPEKPNEIVECEVSYGTSARLIIPFVKGIIYLFMQKTCIMRKMLL